MKNEPMRTGRNTLEHKGLGGSGCGGRHSRPENLASKAHLDSRRCGGDDDIPRDLLEVTRDLDIVPSSNFHGLENQLFETMSCEYDPVLSGSNCHVPLGAGHNLPPINHHLLTGQRRTLHPQVAHHLQPPAFEQFHVLGTHDLAADRKTRIERDEAIDQCLGAALVTERVSALGQQVDGGEQEILFLLDCVGIRRLQEEDGLFNLLGSGFGSFHIRLKQRALSGAQPLPEGLERRRLIHLRHKRQANQQDEKRKQDRSCGTVGAPRNEGP